jgi:DNA repair protein RAD50
MKALDHSIIEYHSEKMREINAILRELWCDVYVRSNTGANDIDFIEIKTEPATEQKSTRRAYNYRVVMRVEGQEVDMRGRCSAGQKVLAAILIRIALAEVFGLEFGMLALDEPTTNLDTDKIDALAAALATLVDKRRQQSNFLLLVITHDERFVELLQQGTHMQACVYRVQRNEHTQASEIVDAQVNE